MVSGQYVAKFSDASHAMPDGMSMNAKYPFMLPRIVRIEGDRVFIAADRHFEGVTEGSFVIRRHRVHGEWGEMKQSGVFEQMFNRPPRAFRFYPFKDENTPAVVQGTVVEGEKG